MAKEFTGWVTVYDSDDRAIEIKATYYPGTEAYFDRSFGNYLPGDPPDLSILAVRHDNKDIELDVAPFADQVIVDLCEQMRQESWIYEDE